MAITIKTGFEGSVHEGDSGLRFGFAQDHAGIVPEQGHFAVTPYHGLIRGVMIAPGTINVYGVIIDMDAPMYLSVGSPSTYTTYGIFMKVKWNELNRGYAEIVVESASGTTLPSPSSTFGGANTMHIPLAYVETPQDSTTIPPYRIRQTVMWGGTSEYQIAGKTPHGISGSQGMRVRCNGGRDLWRWDFGKWTPLQLTGSEWKTFTPEVSSKAGNIYLGNGGVRRGRYKIVSDTVFGEFELRSGTDNYNWGHGPIKFTLPYPPGSDNAPADTWFSAHMYTTTGDGLMDWRIQMIFAKGTRDAYLFAPRSAADCRLRQLSAASSSARTPGTGNPYIRDGVTDPSVITGTFRYPI